MRDWLANLWWRFEVWRFVRGSDEVNVRRSCGHQETLRLLRKGIQYRLAAYRSSPCSECNFYACMAEAKLKADILSVLAASIKAVGD
jgi:hypothetical protein